MGTIIRPRFGGVPSNGQGNDGGDKASPIRVIGSVGGHRVILLHASDPDLGDIVQVVLIPRTGTEAAAVSAHPTGQSCEADAMMVATAVLRALAVVSETVPDAR